MIRVLIIEDNEMNLDMMSRRLKRRGFDVLIATDGAKGVDIVRNERPDIILMDMSLPVMDGWQATRELKADPDVRDIPIIALTAHAIAGDREKCLEAGCDEYESKPVKFPQLMSKMHRLLGVDES